MNTATTSPTAPVVIETPETRLTAAMAEADRVASERAAAEQRLADVRAKSAKLAREIADVEAEAKSAQDAEQIAHQRIIDAERKIAPDPIDLPTARAIAESLIAAFGQFAADRETAAASDKSLKLLYNAIDNSVARTLTDEISDDGKPIILAVVGLLDSVVEWESFRGLSTEMIENRRRMLDLGNTADPRMDFAPTDCGLVRTLLGELRDVLAGKTDRPNRPLESIGELLGQNVAPQQIARMLGFVKADGSGDIAGLGMTIDRALGAAGYFREVAGVAHLSRIGALNRAQAWTMFERSIESRSERAWSRGQVGSIQSAGEHRLTRAGRPLADAPNASIDGDSDLSPPFRHALGKIAERRAAEQAVADHDDVPLDRF